MRYEQIKPLVEAGAVARRKTWTDAYIFLRGRTIVPSTSIRFLKEFPMFITDKMIEQGEALRSVESIYILYPDNIIEQYIPDARDEFANDWDMV